MPDFGIAETIAIVGLLASGAAEGKAASDQHDAKVEATHAKNDQIRAADQYQAQVNQQNQSAEAQKAGAVSLARQRAVAALSTGGNFGGTLGTGAQGATSSTQPGQKTLLGV